MRYPKGHPIKIDLTAHTKHIVKNKARQLGISRSAYINNLILKDYENTKAKD